jgi:hypothetical protein
MGKNQDQDPDHISESLETIIWVKILKFFDADPGSVIEKIANIQGSTARYPAKAIAF